jgi:hypothetical protein
MMTNERKNNGLLLGSRSRGAIKIAVGGGSDDQRKEIRKVLEEITALNFEVADLSAVLQISALENPAADILIMVLEDAPELWASESRCLDSG